MDLNYLYSFVPFQNKYFLKIRPTGIRKTSKQKQNKKKSPTCLAGVRGSVGGGFDPFQKGTGGQEGTERTYGPSYGGI